MWRNWQTRTVQVRILAREWRFKSSHPHQTLNRYWVPTREQERAAHPRIADAIHNMEVALRELEAAPDGFGGNKAAAMRDTRAAIHSLKRALYFRLRMDDAAIDRAQ